MYFILSHCSQHLGFFLNNHYYLLTSAEIVSGIDLLLSFLYCKIMDKNFNSWVHGITGLGYLWLGLLSLYLLGVSSTPAGGVCTPLWLATHSVMVSVVVVVLVLTVRTTRLPQAGSFSWDPVIGAVPGCRKSGKSGSSTRLDPSGSSRTMVFSVYMYASSFSSFTAKSLTTKCQFLCSQHSVIGVCVIGLAKLILTGRQEYSRWRGLYLLVIH